MHEYHFPFEFSFISMFMLEKDEFEWKIHFIVSSRFEFESQMKYQQKLN